MGDFTAAEMLLRKMLKDSVGSNLFALNPTMLIHPMEKIEGGLSQVEERALLELGFGSGARKVRIYTGKELSDAEVEIRLGGK